VDDGPRTEAAALTLAEELVAIGVGTALCTPHYSRRWSADPATLGAAFERLRDALKGARIDLQIALAAEISPAFAVSAPLEALAARSLAGRYLIVEVQSDTPEGFFGVAEERLAGAELVPVFAHPERARAVRRRPRVLENVHATGSVVQVVAPSLAGRWGEEVRWTAWELLTLGLVDVVGSDAHGPRRSPTDLARAAHSVETRLGAHMRSQLFVEEPGRLLAGAL
jgi:protein-tyrosine phosphatase